MCLARAAGNAVVAAIMGALRSGIQAYVTEAVDRLTDWPAMAAGLRAQHRRILTLVEAGEADGAAAAVTAHIAGFYAATGVGGTEPGYHVSANPVGGHVSALSDGGLASSAD